VTTALLTDRYELTMLAGALGSGVASHRAVFEVFARHLPDGRRYGVVAGTGRLLDALQEFRFDDAQIAALRGQGWLDGDTLAWLAAFRFSGDISAFAEGEVYFPGDPVLTVEGPFGECLLLETIVLSVLNHDSAIASAGARMVHAAGGRPLIEMGSRRTHEWAGVAAARAAYLVGFASTSNLEAGHRYGVPTAGTSAHAFTLVHHDESEAFTAQVKALGVGTTLLVDTYDVDNGVRAAVRAAGPTGPGAVRIDSGDLAVEAKRVRRLLDAEGAKDTRIVVSGDLDEFSISALADAPIDAYGVGTSLVTGSGAPTAAFIYKLVAVADWDGAPFRDVAKRSPEKATVGGRKAAVRLLGEHGMALADHLLRAGPPRSRHRPLQVPLVVAGEINGRVSLDASRAHHRAALAELAPAALELDPGPPAIDVTVVGAPDGEGLPR